MFDGILSSDSLIYLFIIYQSVMMQSIWDIWHFNEKVRLKGVRYFHFFISFSLINLIGWQIDWSIAWLFFEFQCAQRASEMREKIKILQNEIEILRTSAQQKDRLLQKQRLRLVNSQVIRDNLRNAKAKQQHIATG